MSDRDQPIDVAASGSDDEHAGARAQDERGGFLGFVAHEIRNPLSTALWSAELLTRLAAEERAGARGEKLAGMCLRALQRLRVLVEDHFLAERLEVGGIPVRLEAVPLREAVDAVAAKAGVEATADIEEDLVAWVDRGLLERGLEGLLAAAGRGKTPVHIAGTRARSAALLRIHGAPIAADALSVPQKGTPSDTAGRALALLVAARVAQALGASLSTAEDDYLLALPLEPEGTNGA